MELFSPNLTSITYLFSFLKALKTFFVLTVCSRVLLNSVESALYELFYQIEFDYFIITMWNQDLSLLFINLFLHSTLSGSLNSLTAITMSDFVLPVLDQYGVASKESTKSLFTRIIGSVLCWCVGVSTCFFTI